MPLAEIVHGFDGVLPPPATLPSLVQLVIAARQTLGRDLPDQYMTLLTQTDGFGCNGLVVYPSIPCEMEGMSIPGVMEVNQRERDLRDMAKDVIILGECDDDYLLYRPSTNLFSLADRNALDDYETDASLESLVSRHLLRLG
jgi:hypothetical protein